MVKFFNERTQASGDEMRQKFEPDARIHDAKKSYDVLLKNGKEIPLSPFAQRIAAGSPA